MMAWKRRKLSLGLKVLFCQLACLLFTYVGASDLQYIIKEDQPPLYVGNVKQDYDLKPNVATDVYNNLIYKILGTGNEFATYFRIVNTTGLLYTTSGIDRDSISQCSSLPACVLQIDIGIQSPIGAFFIKISVDIVVEDINDNVPEFAKDAGRVEFSEGSIKGTYATIAGASDKDAGNYSVQNYHIRTQNVPFDVMMETKADGSSVVKIVVDGELDRETLEYYHITVVAADGGSPPLTAELSVNVTILDANDNKPVFNKPYYNVTVNEDIAINTNFLNVSAKDADKGSNGQVIYRLSPNQNQVIKDTFAINASTGQIRVIQHLVYVPDEQTIIYIEAEDNGSQPKTSQVVVYVYIIDSMNHAPEINVNILSGNVVASISEYANVGAVVAHVGVKDADTERNGRVECGSEVEKFGLERLAVKEYKVVVSGSLNRELQDKYLVIINCHDNGSPPKNSSANFTVNILDENDNPPRFTQGTYFLRSDENNEIGAVVGRVVATDMDIGKNARLTYILKNASANDFLLDSVTGEIRANFVLNRENISQFTLDVAVTDNGDPGLSGSASVVLTVLDQNDNFPVFEPPNYEIFVYEEIPYNTTIEQVSATDNDYGVNGTVFFSFGQSPSANFPFILFTDGTIKAIGRLDREAQPRYEFTVIAADLGSPPLSSSVTVTVVLLDINDYSPSFIFPVTNNNTVTVPLSTKHNSMISTIRAFDNDENENKQLTYSILNGSASWMFVIETIANVGELRALSLPTSPETVDIELKVHDHGTPARSAVQELTVKFVEDAYVDSKNLAIAISLGCVTVVLSIVIVIIIFLVRRHDKNRRIRRDFVDCSTADLQVSPAELKPNLLQTSEQGSIDSLKKVSFSTDNGSALSMDRSKDTSHTPLVNHGAFTISENGRIPTSSQILHRNGVPPFLNGPNVQQMDHMSYPQHRTHIQSHDHIWPSQTTVPTTSLAKDSTTTAHEDNGSESSAETATWDSGNGGSVSDVQSPFGMSYDTDHIKMVTFADKPTHHYIDNTYNSPTPNKLHNQLNLPKLSNCDKTLTPPRGIPHNTSSANNRLSGIRQDQKLSPIQDHSGGGFGNSYDEDDDTTTEGSYTIDTEDWASSPGVEHSRPYTFGAKEAYC